MKKTIHSVVLGGLCLAIITARPPLHASVDQRSASALQREQARFVGAWRLVSLEHASGDGSLERADCTGQFVFTADGHAAVQVMYRNSHASDTASTQYAQKGYEATFGRYEVSDPTQTFTFHVDGALVRTLVGQSLRRAFKFTGNQLIIEPTNKDERWRVVWERE
jgi:hypothetical protein